MKKHIYAACLALSLVTTIAAGATPTGFYDDPTWSVLDQGKILEKLELSDEQRKVFDAEIATLNHEAEPYLDMLVRAERDLRDPQVVAGLDEPLLRKLLSARQFALNELIVLQFRYRQALIALFTEEQQAQLAELAMASERLM